MIGLFMLVNSSSVQGLGIMEHWDYVMAYVMTDSLTDWTVEELKVNSLLRVVWNAVFYSQGCSASSGN